MMVRHIASHTSMKESGPEASAPDALDRRALGPQRREVVADAAALLHRQRRFAQMREDAVHVVGDGAHDEAVEEGDVAAGAGAGQDAARRQELEIGERLVEPLGPESRDRARAPPARSRPAARCPRWSCPPPRRPAPSAGISCPRSAARSRRRLPWRQISSLSRYSLPQFWIRFDADFPPGAWLR